MDLIGFPDPTVTPRPGGETAMTPMIRTLLTVVSAAIAGPALAQDESPARKRAERLVVGYIERVMVMPGNLVVHAKVDTGARTSSLNATEIEFLYRKTGEWIRFSVTNRDNRTVTFERPVVRHARIKELGGKLQDRPVVMLGLCLGNVFRVTEVNLVDRSGFNFQLLVGRQFMRQRVAVDPARRYTAEPACPGAKDARFDDGGENDQASDGKGGQ